MSHTLPAARRWRDLPHPPGWPVLHQLPGFDTRRTHLTLEQWARELGTPYRFNMGPGYRALVFDDPEVAHAVSRQRPEAFTRGGRMQPVMAEMGFNGLFSSEGERWRTQRKRVMGALNATHLRQWLPTLGDGRQSGTSDSPSVLNATPESAAGGGLAWLRDGDVIRVDLNQARCDALVDEAEIARRLAEEPTPPVPATNTPWEELYREKTGQLGQGGVMEFALKYRGTAQKGLPRHNH